MRLEIECNYAQWHCQGWEIFLARQSPRDDNDDDQEKGRQHALNKVEEPRLHLRQVLFHHHCEELVSYESPSLVHGAWVDVHCNFSCQKNYNLYNGWDNLHMVSEPIFSFKIRFSMLLVFEALTIFPFSSPFLSPNSYSSTSMSRPALKIKI